MIIYKKLKPFISLVCTLLIIFSAVSIPVYAADTKSVTASTNASVKQGSYEYCYIYIDSSEELAALDVAVHFDPAKVKILDVYNSISCTLYDSVTNTDNIQFSYIFDGEGAASKARLFYFRYQVLSNADIGNSYFDITIGEAYDNALNDVAVSGSRCNFIIAETITNKTCSVYSSSSMSTSIEQEFTISYRFSTYKIASGTAVISYDPELFEVIEVTNGAFLTNKIVDVNTELNGEIYISFLGTEYYSNTNFISVTFKTIKNVTETSKIVFKATELIDKGLNSISCNGYTTNVNIAFDSTYTGDAPAMKLDGAFSHEDMQITLVVTLEENSRLGAGDFVIAFDPGLVSYNSCTKGFSPSFFNINDKNVENGELKFHIISLSDITTEETVLTVIFDVKHPYSCESADFTLSGKNLTDSLTESILLNFIDASILFDHTYTAVVTAPTCTEKGYTTYTCACGDTYVDDYIDANGHSYKTTKTLATTSKDGKTVTACTVCGYVSKTITYYKASSIKLSATAYTYNGKAQKPTVTVKNSKGTTLKNGTDYTVAYSSGCKNTGKYAVKVTFKGNYSGSKTLYFNILPSKTSKLSSTQTTTSIKATWKAVTGASGYKVVLYSAKNKALKTVYTTKTSTSFTKLSKGTTYKVKVTAYKTIDGKKVLSSVYTLLTTATKPGTPTLKVTAGSKKATLSWNKQTGATGYVVYMATSKNGKYTKIATLKGNTKVSYTKTGLTKGKTYYFKVAAYETVGGKNIYGSFSSVKYAKIK